MRLTTKSRYAVTAMLDIAYYDRGNPISLPEIAERQGISLSYLEQLFSRLKKSGLVESIKGPGGGYKLSKNANDIVISEVIKAVDESVETTACNGKANCHNNQQCLSHNLWEDLGAEINNFLSDVTLQQVILKNNSNVKEIKLSEY
ncbi:MAG: Rrf2 family transcriptional regulator [Gammaproteobacteria bacterium]|jgi:Rrf2 family iron-sulfur cluster assembly transcriptional regulator|nr:Rrf2 family transcriptional regulator [Gammaproteobacteria bacterium]|tara:strand:+ start:655 stop:1092 length:438 start_codon:yes stop_codon:yes gene_type:complete